MLFRVESIPHYKRNLKGKCRGCNRHSTFKVKLHKLTPYMKVVRYEEVPNKKGVMKKHPVYDKEFRPIGKRPYLLCSRRCITMAQLKFL